MNLKEEPLQQPVAITEVPKKSEEPKGPPRISINPNQATIDHLNRWAKEDRRTVALFTTMLIEKLVGDLAKAEKLRSEVVERGLSDPRAVGEILRPDSRSSEFVRNE